MKKKLSGFLAILSVWILVSSFTEENAPFCNPIVGTWQVDGFSKQSIDHIKSDLYLTFTEEGYFHGKLGCNGLSGKYKIEEGEIVFSQMISTMMYCENQMFLEEFMGSLKTAKWKAKDFRYLTISDGENTLALSRK